MFESISDREDVEDREDEPVSISEIESHDCGEAANVASVTRERPGMTLRVVSGDIPS